jgi:hypothetical protein
MIDVPEEYVLQKFYEHAGYPKHKKITNVHEAGCPICNEGHSWGRKRRLYFIPKENVICCHNCGWYSKPLRWIQNVARMSAEEIEYEIETGDYRYKDMSPPKKTNTLKQFNVETLPIDSINMFDTQQLRYYKDNQVVKQCLDFIASRRLDTAVNKPKALYLSLKDPVHKNRLCIPFYDQSNNIVHYQTRGFIDKDLREKPKYLSKLNSQKSLFNINTVTGENNKMYIFEGPIDAFFSRNSVAVAGIQENTDNTLTTMQKQMMQSKSLLEHVWVLDNQWVDAASANKTKMLIDSGCSVFIWPKNLNNHKDFNELSISYKLDEVSTTFIDRHTHSGLSAKIIFNNVK